MQMLTLAISWLVYDITSDPLALGLVGLAQFVPTVFLLLFSGHIADRSSRQSILLCTHGVMLLTAIGLLLFILSGERDVFILYAAMSIMGAARAFEQPAANALLPSLIPLEARKSALAINSIAAQLAVTVGPAVGGFIYSVSPSSVFFFAAIMNIFSVLQIQRLAAVTLKASTPLDATPDALPEQRRGLMSLLAGIAYIRSRPEILGAITIDLLAVLFAGVTALLPVFARDVLDAGPIGLGLLKAAPAIGALVMGLQLMRHPIERWAGPLLLLTVAIYGVSILIFSLSTNFVLSLLMLALSGASDQISVLIRSSLVQLTTPDHLRGRVGAVNSLFIAGSNQLGQFESGVTAAWLGTVPAAALGGVAALVVVLASLVAFPALRRLDRL